MVVEKALDDRVSDLQTQLDKKRQDEKAVKSKVVKIENDYK